MWCKNGHQYKLQYNDKPEQIFTESSSERKSWCMKCLPLVVFPVIVIISLYALCVTVLAFLLASGHIVTDETGTLPYPPPPNHKEYAKMARYVMHLADFASLATISTHPEMEGYPFANVFSVSDGPVGNSSGRPYFYLTELELSVADLREDSRASLTVSLAQTDYCSSHYLDPQSPLCAHIIFTGRIVRVEKESEESEFARKALFERHPAMPVWPDDHDWFIARLNITHIYVLDFFGGAKVVEPSDYYAASPY